MHRLDIDLQANPEVQFRIDAFSVPAAAREELEAAMRRSVAFLATLPGFKGHTVFQKTSGPTTFDIVTIAVWEDADAIANAGEEVRAHYQRIGFDPQELFARTGITASLGYYTAPIALQ